MDSDTPLGLIIVAENREVMPGRDEETGRYTGQYSTDDFLHAINAGGGVAGTGEIADHVGCAHDTAYKRLQEMEEEGLVSSRKVGNTLLWEKTGSEES
ncbi:winged helix-turn-helix domain-containing protein [Halorussus halobius]|jgi:predicted ArsR family transcriptional regulator|uniref:winged helix-turn-helix domain-containing protein n=1 Tax=Halorussus halobius TaxID=1710537 RepID=UPI001FCE6058|nr:helix-turn-helix domain-containing protein [Halorussus halobius]